MSGNCLQGHYGSTYVWYIMVYLPTVHEMVDVYADVYVSVFFVVNLVGKHTSQSHGSSGTDSLI